LQKSKKFLCYLFTSAGIFGPITQSAVIAFQNAAGLNPDGIVGPLTWAAMFA
jgi:peptidoglycan hydrolase-like protein with peptidoglycan-binding domain